MILIFDKIYMLKLEEQVFRRSLAMLTVDNSNDNSRQFDGKFSFR